MMTGEQQMPFDPNQMWVTPAGFVPMPSVQTPNFPMWVDKNFDTLNNEPYFFSWWQLLGKTFIWLVIGGVIAALLFIILSFVGSMFTDALQQSTVSFQTNPLLPLLLLFIGFLWSFVGNIAVGLVYGLFFGKKYYNTSKMLGFLLLTNAIILIVLIPVYLIFSKQVDTLFLVLGFHIVFSVFVSASQIEFLANPNFAGSALMGNVLGFAMVILWYSVVYKLAHVSSVQQQTYLLMVLPPILAFTLVPFFSWIWEKVYYKFYEMGNNVFYIPSISEVAEEHPVQEDEVNVEIG